MSTLPFTDLIERMIRVESGGNPNAVSSVGAAGLMQVMPDTARAPGFGVAPLDWNSRFDPTANRAFGEQYMQALINYYHGDQMRAAAAYNWGAGNVDNWNGDMAALPAETRAYVGKIFGGGDLPVSGAPGGAPGAPVPGAAPAAPIPAPVALADVFTGAFSKPAAAAPAAQPAAAPAPVMNPLSAGDFTAIMGNLSDASARPRLNSKTRTF